MPPVRFLLAASGLQRSTGFFTRKRGPNIPLFTIYSRTTSILRSDASLKRNFSSTAVFQAHLNYETRGDVAVITFDSPNSKVNTLGEAVMSEFKKILEELNGDNAVQSAVLISGKYDCFIAGADIQMLQRLKTAEEIIRVSTEGQRLMQELSGSEKPIVAAIMGPCLGGGLEVALAAHYRIAVLSKKTTLALPEVLLGLLPGAGGTQRLPALIGVPNALDMMLTGKNIRPDKAKKIGLIDHTVDMLGPGLKHPDARTRDYLEEVAIDIARDLASGKMKRPPRKLSVMDKITNYLLTTEYGRNYIFNQARDKVMKSTNGLYPAPLKIIEVVKTSVEKGSKEGYIAESKGFGELGITNESNALIGLFHGQTACRRNSYGKPEKPTEVLSVLGAGLMGAGIAQVSIDKGYTVILKDTTIPGLTRGQQQIESGMSLAVKKKKITSFEKETILSHLHGTTNYDGFEHCDMVIEAVFEDLQVKHKVVKEVEQKIKPHCIFASNTSALPISRIAEASLRPEKVIGMHYFSPVDKMALMEIITTNKTSKDTIATAVEVSLKQGKTVIVVKDSPGFYTTRCLGALYGEVFQLLCEGVSPTRLDELTKKLGFPVGSAVLVDEVGIDVGSHIGKYLGGVYKDRWGDGSKLDLLLTEMTSKGLLGRKSGEGLYVYQPGVPQRSESIATQELLKKHFEEPKLELTDENIQMRLLTRFVNESILCQEEDILRNPLDGDIGMVFGLGFPPFLGGPFRYVDNFGADKFVSIMAKFEKVYGNAFIPCQLLLDHAKDTTKKFHPDSR